MKPIFFCTAARLMIFGGAETFRPHRKKNPGLAPDIRVKGALKIVILCLCGLWALGLGIFAPPSAKAQTLTTLYNFCSQAGCTDGNQPLATLVQGSDGNFYGTTGGGGEGGPCTLGGGHAGCGTVFKITPSGTFTKLYDFCAQANCADGSQPVGTLVQGNDGNFYGTTETGLTKPNYCAHISEAGCGTVFKITPEGALSTLYTFCSIGGTNCTDGALPTAGLVLGSDGNFYGTTASGGTLEGGTVYQITPGGTLTTIYNFCGLGNCFNGFEPGAGVVQGSDGNFYGTTYTGSGGGGTVYKLTPSGTLTTIYSFCSQLHCADGENPDAIVLGSDGNFYGTTSTYGGYGNPAYGGTVFKITPAGTLTTLDSFCLGCAAGDRPYGSLIQASDGNFYGTALFGGTHGACGTGGDGCGTAYKVTPGGALTAVYDFCSVGTYPTCLDGTEPYGGLVQGTNYNFYGTTSAGGKNGSGGTVFVLAALPVANVSPTSLTFASQDEGTTSPSQPVTLSNTGPAPLLVSSIVPSAGFGETDDCNGSVAPLKSCTINVTFAPTATGSQTGMLTVTDNSGGVNGSQQTVSPLTGTGINPGAGLSPATLGLGSQVINTTSAVKKVTLLSSGTTALMNITVFVTGTNAGDFAETNNCPTTLSIGAKCTVSLTYTPSILGTETATLAVTDNAANSPQTVALKGTGEEPVTLGPTTLGFGHVGEYSPSASKTIKVTNNQTVVLTISSIMLSNSDYSETDNCVGTVAAKGNCTINVTLTPSVLTTDDGTLTVNDNASNSPQATLTGTGVVPAKLSLASLGFGNVPQSIVSTAKNITLTNNEAVALSISSITTGNPDFAETDTCDGSVAAKGNCVIAVAFTPSIIGAETGTLTVTDAASNSPQTVGLTGTGTAQATVSPASLTFASQKVGTTSGAKTVTLTNNLSTTVTVGAVTFTGSDPGDFASPPNPCGGGLGAKSKCTISVTFTPTATGARTATMNVNNGANNTPQTVALTGTGK